MNSRIELLAPGGDIDSIKAAIAAGAGAVYCGLKNFNARNRAANLSLDELNGVLGLAHRRGCKVFLTLNIIVVQSDIPALFALLNKLVNTGVDGIIVQDLGLLHLLRKYFPRLQVHASTQLTTHNRGQIKFLSRLGVGRVNLSRELDIGEIRELTRAGREVGICTEVFVHGSYCISFSGICFMSSVSGGHSGNRGMCSQPCRDRYQPTDAGMNFPLNLKDNSAFFDLGLLAEAGVRALKIEGRMKKAHYVYTVTRAWRRQLDSFHGEGVLLDDDSDLYKVFNRDFSNAYLSGDMDKGMFSDHPRNNSATHQRQEQSAADEGASSGQWDRPFQEIARIKAEVRETINALSIEQAPLAVSVSGADGSPLTVCVKTPEHRFEVKSEANLVPQGNMTSAQHLNRDVFLDKFKAINDTRFFIDHLDLDKLNHGLFISFRELTGIRKKILFALNGSRGSVDPVAVPTSPRPRPEGGRPGLSVLIDAPGDLSACREAGVDVHFQLPSCLGDQASTLEAFIADNRDVTPWFPPVLIGADFDAAAKLLRRIAPRQIVADNTGLAHEAHDAGVPWIAGPNLNIANSHGLVCLKESFGCRGAFVSNELGQHQLRKIAPPEAFELYYSIYHPITLMTSRQCLFHQVTGCDKDRMDEACLGRCAKAASITDLRGKRFMIHKSMGDYCRVYNEANFLNTDVLADIPGLFSRLLIDIRDIPTGTRAEMDKNMLIQLFADHLAGRAGAVQALQSGIHPTTCRQYRKGL